MKFNIVMKIGGSIFENPKILSDFLHSFLISLNSEVKYIILVGGGNSCNKLREEYKIIPTSKRNEADFHWRCIKIMDSNAIWLSSQLMLLTQNVPIQYIEDVSPKQLRNPGIFIVRPYKNLITTDPLEHSWQVTSDAISVYYAYKTSSPICVLVKNRPFFLEKNSPVQSISSTNLIPLLEQEKNFDLGKGFIDPVSPHLCKKYKIPILMLDGTNHESVASFFSSFPKCLKDAEFSKFGIEITPK